MKEDRALELATRIINAVPGWSEDATVELIHEIQCWGDEGCAEAAVTSLCRSWTDSRRPTLGKVIEFYNLALEDRQRRVQAAPQPRRVELSVSPKEGREIAFQAYRQSLGLPDSAESRARFRWGDKERGKYVEGTATDEEVARVEKLIGRGATYGEIVTGFHGDHLRARRALRTLEKRRVIRHGDDGWIVPVHAAAQ